MGYMPKLHVAAIDITGLLEMCSVIAKVNFIKIVSA